MNNFFRNAIKDKYCTTNTYFGGNICTIAFFKKDFLIYFIIETIIAISFIIEIKFQSCDVLQRLYLIIISHL